MFNENDLRFATERLQALEATAEQARRTAARPPIRPFWVRVFDRILDRSHWTLVLKSEITRSVPLSSSIDFAPNRSDQAEREIH